MVTCQVACCSRRPSLRLPNTRSAAFRKGLQTIAKFVKSCSGAADDAVQRFFAYGQLCHLITTISLDGNSAAWARMLTTGMRHP
jgi:hypothetical protein